jgi:structural maintenance of chromosome 3 (chondroitin sulfate proteoglycan 6)
MVYIKQLTIQGFKSYKDQTQVEPFSPGHNVIVGRNGSGKSNFFAAIRFVLGDAYSQMGREERQALLHEGSGSAVMSAYVEILFDNSDDRFHTGKPDLTLRRTIGLKKDEFSVDRKNATRTDVMNMLESAGFSRSNPYYIVPQGRVTALTNMKDVERLNLLKEISGTQVYENRRSDSLKLMQETDNKREKIDDLLRFINERLDELETEKEELQAYHDKDRERRSLLFAIYDKEKTTYTENLSMFDERRQDAVQRTEDLKNYFIENEKEMERIDSEIDRINQEISIFKDERDQYESDRRDSARSRAQLELEVQELTAGQSTAQKAKMRHDTQLQQVQQQIQARQQELNQLLPEYNAKMMEEANIKSQLSDAVGQRKRLEDKQGRTAFYTNKRQRDDALQQEIDNIGVDLAKQKAVSYQTNEEIAELQSEVKRLEGELEELRSTIDNQGDNTMDLATKVQQARDVRDNLQDKKKELWREEAKLDSQILNRQQELARAERTLSHMMDHNTSRGLESLRRLKRQHNLDGVYGTLAELCEYPEHYKTAIEVTAGNSLFHVVVDNDLTATKVVELLTKERGGRVTCIPLNRIRTNPVNIPQASDVVPLIARLKYDAKYDGAFQHVFGKTIVCSSLQICSQYARSHAVSAITIDGDRADKKGVLFGGWFNPQNSRLDAVHAVNRLREEVEKQQTSKADVTRQLEQLEQKITAAMGEVRKLDLQKHQIEGSYGPMRQELRSKQIDLQNKQDELDRKQRSAANIEAAIRNLSNQQEELQAEKDSDFKKALSKDEERQLAALASTVQDLRRQYSKLSAERSELESRKAEIEVELRENLQPMLDQLLTQDSSAAGGDNKTRLSECQRALKRINRTIDTNERIIRETDAKIEEKSAELAAKETEKAEKQQENIKVAQTIEKHQKKMDRSMRERVDWNDKLNEVKKNIVDLGTVPEDAWRKYQKLSVEQATTRLRKVNESLKKFAHVNKKAFEQYQNFTRQRQILTDRRSDLDTSRKSIEDLIQHLDTKKDEAIERTFKQVSMAFAKVFEKLVPAGQGRLIIQRKSDKDIRAARGQAADDESSDDEGRRTQPSRRKTGVENYSGVGISVSFNSKHDEQQRIQQLSGGQKSLCALALVFAIQQCDPAPFYLFDEIDANLDAQYRTAVANMLQSLSANDGEEGRGQFICTTFRPEMVLVAAKCYGVSYSNKTSSIDVVDREAALQFVEGQKA